MLLAAALAYTVLRPPPTQGPFGRDFEAYYAAGAVWNAGGDPWSRAVWNVERTIDGVDPSRDELLPYAGPAAALPLFGALARLPHAVALRCWSALLAAAYAGLVLAVLALAGVRRVGPLLAAFAFGIASGAGTSALALGQAALLSAAGTAAALLAFERRTVTTGALATLLAGIQPNLALALLARLRDRAALLGSALGLAAFTLLTLWAGGGPRGVAAYVARLGEHARAERFDAIQYAPASIAASLGAPDALASAIGVACAAVAVAAVIAIVVVRRLGARDGALVAIALLPLAVPFFHEHDFVLLLIPATLLALTSRGRLRAASGVAVALLLVDWFGLAQRPGAAGQIVALGAVTCCAFVALGRGERATRADLAPFVALAALASVAIPLAHAFPAPVWPDALPPGFHAAAGAGASAVWAAEQHAAGLDARVPAWALLRTLPLLGCILLAITVARSARNAERPT
ncbi:MAG TPA: glycosyltransferase 87 family protein [Candidatus Elarobacter sp.]|nr:glycosyltransferase 87 family protein [Candidatus Elarobacter sp.]